MAWKKKINRYNTARYRQYMFYMMLAALLILAGMKTVYMMEKVTAVQYGLSLYQQERWLEAEEILSEADKNHWFNYKKTAADQALQQLKWVTDYKGVYDQLYSALEKSVKQKDYDSFISSEKKWQTLRMTELTDQQRSYLLSQFPVDTAVSDGFKSFKGWMQACLEHPENEETYKWAKNAVFDVPAIYFSTDKEKAIRALFVTCDEQLFEKIKRQQPAFGQLIKTLNEIYSQNAGCGFATSWLTDKVQAYIRERMEYAAKPLPDDVMQQVKRGNPQFKDNKEKAGDSASSQLKEARGQITVFTEVVKTYRSQADPLYYDQQIEKLISDYVQQKEQEISQLIDGCYFDEAVSWYEAMAYFKKYDIEIEKVKSIKEYTAPWEMVKQDKYKYPVCQEGRGAFGADKYLIALNSLEKQLELHLLTGTSEKHQINKIVVKFSDIHLTSAMLNSMNPIKLSGGLLMLNFEEGNVHKVRILKYEEGSLQLILEETGKKMTASDDLKKLQVTDPESESVLGIYNYLYENGSYRKEDSTPVAIELSQADLGSLLGHSVSFCCYIPEEDTGNPATGYYYELDRYSSDKFVKLQLEAEGIVKPGIYRIEGKIVNMTDFWDEKRPVVAVTKWERQEEEP